jgi:hypothetical protein
MSTSRALRFSLLIRFLSLRRRFRAFSDIVGIVGIIDGCPVRIFANSE